MPLRSAFGFRFLLSIFVRLLTVNSRSAIPSRSSGQSARLDCAPDRRWANRSSTVSSGARSRRVRDALVPASVTSRPTRGTFASGPAVRSARRADTEHLRHCGLHCQIGVRRGHHVAQAEECAAASAVTSSPTGVRSRERPYSHSAAQVRSSSTVRRRVNRTASGSGGCVGGTGGRSSPPRHPASSATTALRQSTAQ